MTNPDNFPFIDWTVAPDPYEIENLRDAARLPLWEKLEWLEAAQRLVEQIESGRALRQKDKINSL
ncbi:hypothetical protein B1R32_10830 [Abditibacterium utsteinense]|uniref:Uncharacterized protein n=1 Tax=Abditibacterium utsteinense TaxID=1960156 RepID=A0A2S8SSS1_9BACT|nr:hypothetical protein [Abditibacterium utsteinense]PQV63826.1 hypothetical protein B1R32_10830 [Abditibacterium utsteinense]